MMVLDRPRTSPFGRKSKANVALKLAKIVKMVAFLAAKQVREELWPVEQGPVVMARWSPEQRLQQGVTAL